MGGVVLSTRVSVKYLHGVVADHIVEMFVTRGMSKNGAHAVGRMILHTGCEQSVIF